MFFKLDNVSEKKYRDNFRLSQYIEKFDIFFDDIDTIRYIDIEFDISKFRYIESSLLETTNPKILQACSIFALIAEHGQSHAYFCEKMSTNFG
jgi:hypothetical protein